MDASPGPTAPRAPEAAVAPTAIPETAEEPMAAAHTELAPTTWAGPMVPAKLTDVFTPVTTVVMRALL